METIDFHPRTRFLFGAGMFDRLAEFVTGKRVLLVSDTALASYAGHAKRLLKDREVFVFSDFAPNPDTAAVERGREFAAGLDVDFIVALGGGSAMDTAKGINFVLTNGGSMVDYWGHGKAHKPMLPSIGIPTTAGTGSEAQSYCIISDAVTHKKMACGDEKAAFQVALLDPVLTLSQPPDVAAAAGYDALSHAVEAFVTTKGNAISRMFAREAFRLIEPRFERVIDDPKDLDARGAMLLGAHLAGIAIENSMLGATHACANPLTARYGTTHGVAIAMLLPHVVRWNSETTDYRDLYPNGLPDRLNDLARAAGMPERLRDAGVPDTDLATLAEDAAGQWTGRFNPRDFGAIEALEIYKCAY